MALFKPKRPIQLGTESEETSRSSWSIPCCVNLSLYKGPAIQLPEEDSDNDQDDLIQSESEEPPSIFSQRSTQILSRNPFARAVEPTTIIEPTIIETTPTTIETFEQEVIHTYK